MVNGNFLRVCAVIIVFLIALGMLVKAVSISSNGILVPQHIYRVDIFPDLDDMYRIRIDDVVYYCVVAGVD
jgi:hypothetical protein